MSERASSEPKRARFTRVWCAALFGLIAVISLAVIQLVANDGNADATTLGFLGLAIALLFVVIAPAQTRDVFERVTKLKVGTVELGLAEIKRAARVRPLPSREDDDVTVKKRPRLGSPILDYKAIANRLRARLRFIYVILAFEEEGFRESDYDSIIDTLRRRGLINFDEETFIHDLLTDVAFELDDWPVVTRDEFLDSAWEYATRLGSQVWDRNVRENLSREAHH